MNRRQFLKSMFASAVVLAIPQQLIPEVNKYFEINSVNSVVMDDAWFSENVIRPAAQRLAEKIDQYVFEKCMQGEIK